MALEALGPGLGAGAVYTGLLAQEDANFPVQCARPAHGACLRVGRRVRKFVGFSSLTRVVPRVFEGATF